MSGADGNGALPLRRARQAAREQAVGVLLEAVEADVSTDRHEHRDGGLVGVAPVHRDGRHVVG